MPTGIIAYVVAYRIDPDSGLLHLHVRMPTGEERHLEMTFVADGVHYLVFWAYPPDDALVCLLACPPAEEHELTNGGELVFNAGNSQRAVEITQLLLPHLRARDITRLEVYRD